MSHTIDFEAEAEQAVNNWEHFDSFALSDRDAFVGKTIVYTRHRNSQLLDRCNADVIAKRMKPFLGRTCEEFTASHWAVGYVEGYAIQVFTTKGKVTAAFKVWCEIQAKLADYCILDENAYSEAEHDEACRICEEQGWDINNEDEYERAITWANE